MKKDRQKSLQIATNLGVRGRSSKTRSTLLFLLRQLYGRQQNPEGVFRVDEIRDYVQRLHDQHDSFLD